jgi:hypothetical protein
VALTFVPESPQSPPENVWMREPASDVAALLLHEPPRRGRVAYLPADLDRCTARDHIPDHARLLAELVRWAARRPLPLQVEGPGLLDCHLYRQERRLVLHLVNLTNPAAFRLYATELYPVGPLRVRVACPPGLAPTRGRRLVAGGEAALRVVDGWAELTLDSLLDHEVLVIE